MDDGYFLIVTLDDESEVQGFALREDCLPGDEALVVRPGSPDHDPAGITARFFLPWDRIRKVYADRPASIAAQPKLWMRTP